MSASKKLSKSKEQDIVAAVKRDPSILEGILEIPEAREIIVQQQKIHSGPLPAPEDIELYNKSIPYGADRIMKMAEKSLELSEKRLECEYSLKREDQKIQHFGQKIGIFVVAVFAILSVYIAYLGDTRSAAWLMGAGLASLVATFIVGNRKKPQ
ncbi:TPA: DUF2335 domain-containing protein [Haemophilus influenzae]|uniref:DUF2335 domain-containing protein n=2 Tax=Haemophilus influenzae TaxID=727 RepID=UPI000E57A69B|nr:DUF2335 domain-containing protein [Haemophilus influenzae]MCK8951277.1 DUF2335 domain-containing protein [Haemophilus influenzae]MCK9030089.1 DUF2335 domain-containing protein [Haemophilus influenzae]